MPIHLIDVIAPIVVALIYIGAVSFFNEPQRRHFNAIMIAGANSRLRSSRTAPSMSATAVVATTHSTGS